MSAGTVLLGSMYAMAMAHGAPSSVRAGDESPPEPIIGGEPTEPGEYDGVVAFAAPRLCSGTVVAPRLVLTAAHCLADAQSSGAITVYYGDERRVADSVIAASWGIHPQYCAECSAHDTELFDFGYLTLPADFTVPGGYTVPIVEQDLWDATMYEGAPITVVGYGEDEASQTGVKRKVTTEIRRFTSAGVEFFAGGDYRDSCRGDSGGPAFVMLDDGQRRLAGVTSRGSNPCGDGGWYGVPFWALSWVRGETGVDLLGTDCAHADCLDTTPPSTPGCVVAGPRSPWSAALALWVVATFVRRRQKQGRAQPERCALPL